MSDIKIAFCIPTYGHSEMILEFLEQYMFGYEMRGIDIYIYDSSPDDKTELLVNSFQIQTNSLYYIRLPENMPAGAKIYQIFKMYGLKKGYDFVWACGDGIRYPLKALDKILSQISQEYDVIHVNAMDEEGIGTRDYEDKNKYFVDCAWHTTLFGALLLNCHTMLKGVRWKEYEKRFLKAGSGYPHVCFYFNRILELQQFKAKHISGYLCYTSKLKKRSGWYDTTFSVLGDKWINAIKSLPDFYTNKEQVIHKLGKYSAFENEYAFLQRRKDKVYNENIYNQYKSALPQICDVPLERLKEIAVMTPEQAEQEMKNFIEKRRQNGVADLKSFMKNYSQLVIYGAGLNAKRYARVFEVENIDFLGFCVTERKQNENELMGHQIYALEELLCVLKETGIYLALNIVNRKQVKELLKKKGMERQLFYNEELDNYVRLISEEN